MTVQAFLSFSRALPEPYVLLTRAGTIIAGNPAAVRLLGLESGVDPQSELADLVLEPAEQVATNLDSCARSGSMLPGSFTLRRSGERQRFYGCVVTSGAGEPTDMVLLRFEPQRSASAQFLTLNQSIDQLTREARERRRAEEALRESERRATFLAEVSRILGSSLNYERTISSVAHLAVPIFADWCAVDILEPEHGVVRVAVAHVDPQRVRFAYEISERYPADPDAPYGAFHVIRTGKSDYFAEIPEQLLEDAAVDDEHLALMRRLELRSYISTPLVTTEGTIGALTFVYAESGRTYTEADVVLAEDLGRRAGTAIHNARLVAEVEESRDRIAEQATALESQTEELQAQARQLEEQAAELEHQLDDVQKLNDALADANQQLTMAGAQAEQARAQAEESRELAELARAQAEEAREHAERANRAKSQFLAVMSHELRTPINAIMGYTDLLAAEISGALNETQRTQLERVRNSSVHLTGLIDQVLSLARIEAGRTEIRREAVDLVVLTREAVAMIEPLATRRGLDVRTALPAAVEPVFTDSGKLTQILLNLLSNAVKFTEAGHVEVTLEHVDDSAVFEVRDTGTGIAAPDLERVFEPFMQLEQQMTRRVGGTGLGLSVSRELARLMGGELTVVSEAGVGSTFTLTLPAPQASLLPDDQVRQPLT